MSELHLLTAVRDRIRAHAAYESQHCDVEYDELAPAVAPDLYIIVWPGAGEAGDLHSGGRTIDDLYAVNVSIALRAPKKPRDRKRDLVIELTKSFYVHEKQVRAQLDFDYTTITNANNQMITDGEATGTCDTFIEPLRYNGRGNIRNAPAEIFGGTQGEPIAALIRTIRFSRARRLVSRS